MKEYEFYLAGSLEKVFWNRMPEVMKEGERICILKGEVPALQLVYRRKREPEEAGYPFVQCEVRGFPVKARMRDVENIPSMYPCSRRSDDDYLSKEPGLFPDLLKPKKDHQIKPVPGLLRALWIDFPGTADVSAGRYPVEIELKEGEETEILSFLIEVSDQELPAQRLLHTEWFHGDCLADYYHTEVFSAFHWQVIENQIKMAAELGINMLLTPVFTPPLDTEIGKERTTIQLVDVSFQDEKWSFGFEKLEKWCAICRKYGIEYLEIPHLFTQWGAKAAPKIIVRTGRGEEKMFGWHTPSDSPAYRSFLYAFLPALQTRLAQMGYGRDQLYFHISDEPSAENLETYQRAKEVVDELLDGWQVIDALSEYEYYEKGLVQQPVVANNYIQPFIDREVKELWTYYCCGQAELVPNRFFAMPSARNRIMGVLMYLYRIKGFLHWGYNFYNSSFSREHINPYFDTHADYSFQSGDAFLVYPGPDGQPWSSIRGEVMREALYDLRALEALEALKGRRAVKELIYEGQDRPFTFKSYPREASYFYELRRKISDRLTEL